MGRGRCLVGGEVSGLGVMTWKEGRKKWRRESSYRVEIRGLR